MAAILWDSIERLAPLGPRFVSVTYGADGSTRERTHELVTRIQRDTALTGAPHLTCIGASRGEILAIARGYWSQGIRHLVALLAIPRRARAHIGRTPRIFATRWSWSQPSPRSRRSTSPSRPTRRCIR